MTTKRSDLGSAASLDTSTTSPLNTLSPAETANAYEALPASYTHLRAHETKAHPVCRLLLEKLQH